MDYKLGFEYKDNHFIHSFDEECYLLYIAGISNMLDDRTIPNQMSDPEILEFLEPAQLNAKWFDITVNTIFIFIDDVVNNQKVIHEKWKKVLHKRDFWFRIYKVIDGYMKYYHLNVVDYDKELYNSWYETNERFYHLIINTFQEE